MASKQARQLVAVVVIVLVVVVIVVLGHGSGTASGNHVPTITHHQNAPDEEPEHVGGHE